VRTATGGRGADVVVDPVGGEAFAGSLRCMAPEGRLLVIGFAAGAIGTVEANKLLLRSIDVIGVNYGGLLQIDQAYPALAHADLLAWREAGTLHPVAGQTFELAEGARALGDLAARRVTGKPVLRVR
jgi:NADPH2:quinone reductase